MKSVAEQDNRKQYQTQEEMEEDLLQQLENLFDKPQLIPMTEHEDKERKSHMLTDNISYHNIGKYNQPFIQALAHHQHKQHKSSSKQSIIQDIITLTLELTFKLSSKNPEGSKRLIEIIKKLTSGKRFQRCHIEYIYQFINVKCRSKFRNNKSKEAKNLLDTAINLLQQLFEQRFERFEQGPQNYFYFSGANSGLQVITKDISPYPFHKGFTVAMWFSVAEQVLQDDKNLPVLFNCFSQGFGGFEYVDSNGVAIGEFSPKSWYFLVIEHEKSFMHRSQLTAIINDKQVINIPMDYPKIEKNVKISFMHIYKIVYDCVEQYDGEMLFNTNVLTGSLKSKLFYCGGLNSLLPLLEFTEMISKSNDISNASLCQTVNEFLKIVRSIISMKSYSLYEADNSNFFNILFLLMTRLPKKSVSNETIQILADIRFQIGESKLQEQFFQNLLFSSDFWINTDNVEVINEYWSFVKAIYSQNPVYYNRIFPIQNLIDLMAKISDIKDGHCCDYHQNCYILFYQGQKSGDNALRQEKNRVLTLEQHEASSRAPTTTQHSQSDLNYRPLTTEIERTYHPPSSSSKQKVYNIEKYLSPIVGVLECVLTSGGDDILDQIQHIAKSLSLKSQPCFYLQMLKLLKVLLLDSKDEGHCAKPSDFAAHFLNAKGLNILLHLCSNFSFDVKSMCIKLIDVLSSHTSLIKVRIELDLITYLCNIILPKQIVEAGSTLKQSQLINSHKVHIGNENQAPINAKQYQLVEEEELIDLTENKHDDYSRSMIEEPKEDQVENNQQQEKDIENEEVFALDFRKPPSVGKGKKMKFGKELFLEEEQDTEQQVFDKSEGSAQKQDQIAEIIPIKMPNKKQSSNKRLTMLENDEHKKDFQDILENDQNVQLRTSDVNREESQDFVFEETGFKKQPSGPKSRGPKFDFDAQDSDVGKKKFNQTSKNFFGGKNIQLQGLEEESKSEEEDFGHKKFLNTQKFGNKKASNTKVAMFKPKALELNLPDEPEHKPPTSNVGRGKRPMMFTDLDSQDKEEQKEESDESSEDKEFLVKPKEKVSFANENVMSKSNLREPKSFNFGFSDDEEEDQKEEEDKNQDSNKDLEEIDINFKKEPPQAQSTGKKPILLMQKGFGSQPKSKNQKNSIQKMERPQLEGLENEEDQKEEIKEVKAKKSFKKPNMNLGTTGATNDDNSYCSSEKSSTKKAMIQFQKQNKLFTNANLKLNIDTEAINELFTYGGEKGALMKTEDQELQDFENAIEELASMCVAAMNRESAEDAVEYQDNTQIKKSSFETKYLSEEGNSKHTRSGSHGQKSSKQQFMTPQSVRGIKKIEFSLTEKEKKELQEGKPSKRRNSLTNNTIIEENSPLATSKTSSSKQDYMFGGNQTGNLTLQSDFFAKENTEGSKEKDQKSSKIQKAQTITFAQIKQENFEFDSTEKSDLKQTGNEILQLETFGLDTNTKELEKIQGVNDEYTSELENLYTSCLEWIISRAPSALYQNIVVDEVDKISFTSGLSLLMTLVTYSNNFVRQKALQDLWMLASARWDSHNSTQILFHPQFHYWLLDLLMPYQDLTASYINLHGSALAVYDMGCKLHTLLLKTACMNPEEDAYKKLNFIARWPQVIYQQMIEGKGRTEKDVETAHKLTRNLFNNLIRSLKEEAHKLKPQVNQNYPSWKNLIHITTLIEELTLCSNSKSDNWENLPTDMSQDVNGSVFKWIQQQEYLLYYNGSNEKSLWAEWDVLEMLFQALDPIYPESLLKKAKEKSSQLSNISEGIFNLLSKTTQDDYSTSVEILMYEGKQTNSPAIHNSADLVKPKRGIRAAFNPNQQQTIQPLQLAAQLLQNASSGGQDVIFMKHMLNLLCITLSQADTKQLVQHWLERLERFVKFIMLVSESWTSKNINYYNIVQRRFTEAITFAFTFLFHEIHSTNRSSVVATPTSHSQNQSQFSSQQSPKEQQSFNKLYSQSLKNLMMSFLNIVDYSRTKMKPSKLESYQYVSACRNVFHNVLVKSLGQSQNENLLSFKDIDRFKQSEYDDFPECFSMDDWKVTFFYSEIIKKIVKKQLNYEQIESFIHKRVEYCQHTLEIQTKVDKTKDEILRRMQSEILDVVFNLNEVDFERKNKVALLNESFFREQRYYLKRSKRQLKNEKGVWRSLGEKFLCQSWYKTRDGSKPYLKVRDTNGFAFIKNNPKLERAIFKQVIGVEPEIEVQQEESKHMITQDSDKPLLKYQNRQKSEEKPAKYDSEEDEEEKDDEEEINQQEKDDSNQDDREDVKIVEFFHKNLSRREKFALKNSYLAHLKEYVLQQRPKGKHILEMKCAILRPLYQRVGIVLMTTNELIFFDELYQAQQQEKDNIFFFNYQKQEDDLLYKIVPLINIKEIQRRRFLGKKSALEVFMMDNTSLLFNFNTTEDRDQFAKKIIRQRNQKCQNLKYNDSLDPRRILKKRDLTEKWSQWKISNFEYLMNLNMLAGRSYNDLSQYPVMPWIFIDFTSQVAPDIQLATGTFGSAPPGGFRDLSKNMQLHGTAERQAEYKRKYEDEDNFASKNEKFHCGSHYSNPGIVVHYLSRVSPFIDASVELHNSNLDKADRAFNSVQGSLDSALRDFADVRELIPEFYYLPEMFLNLNMINFGKRQDGQEVNNVVLPHWCQEDPYKFVAYLREALECSYVSQNLGGWIDYIFGIKQRDQEAEKHLNIYPPLTYEDAIDMNNVNDDLMLKSYQLQIFNYGQTPSQLFVKKQQHPARLSRQQALKYNLVVDSQAKTKIYKPVSQQPPITKSQSPHQKILIQNEAILKAKFVDDTNIVGVTKDGTVINFIWISKSHELNPSTPFTCCEDKKKKFDSKTKLNGIDNLDKSTRKFDFPMCILNQTKQIVRGGFWDGKISLCNFDGQYQTTADLYPSLSVHQSTVTCIQSAQNEKMLITGSKHGDVIVWTYTPNHEQTWTVRKHMCDHENQISCIHINEDMGLYITSSLDGTANLYNWWNDKLIRTFKHPNLTPILSIILTETPLPAVCFYSREDHMWHSFSINGHLLEKDREESSHIISPIIVKDSHFMDKLVYGNQNGLIFVRSLPFLKIIRRSVVSQSYPILSVLASPDRRFLLVGCGDGGLNVMTEPPNVQSSALSSIQSKQSSLSQTISSKEVPLTPGIIGTGQQFQNIKMTPTLGQSGKDQLGLLSSSHGSNSSPFHLDQEEAKEMSFSQAFKE